MVRRRRPSIARRPQVGGGRRGVTPRARGAVRQVYRVCASRRPSCGCCTSGCSTDARRKVLSGTPGVKAAEKRVSNGIAEPGPGPGVVRPACSSDSPLRRGDHRGWTKPHWHWAAYIDAQRPGAGQRNPRQRRSTQDALRQRVDRRNPLIVGPRIVGARHPDRHSPSRPVVNPHVPTQRQTAATVAGRCVGRCVDTSPTPEGSPSEMPHHCGSFLVMLRNYPQDAGPTAPKLPEFARRRKIPQHVNGFGGGEMTPFPGFAPLKPG